MRLSTKLSDLRFVVKEATEMQGNIKLLARGTQLANTWKAADDRGHPLWQNSEVDAGWGYFFIFQPNFTRPGLTRCDPGSSAAGIYYAFVDSLMGALQESLNLDPCRPSVSLLSGFPSSEESCPPGLSTQFWQRINGRSSCPKDLVQFNRYQDTAYMQAIPTLRALKVRFFFEI